MTKTYEVLKVAGYWRVMCDRKLVSTYDNNMKAWAAVKRYKARDKELASSDPFARFERSV